jgi:hypothetical protein
MFQKELTVLRFFIEKGHIFAIVCGSSTLVEFNKGNFHHW